MRNHHHTLRPALRARGLLLLAAVCLPVSVQATNADFQNFFFAACANPAAGLASRCAETTGGLGDLSGDSESSLNPSQTLSTNDAALTAAQQRGQEIRERLRADQESTDAADAPRVDVGPFSLLINAVSTTAERDRTVDVDAERGYELDQIRAELGLDYRINDHLVWGGWVQWESSDLEFDRENPGNNFNPLADAGEVESDSFGVTTYLSAQLGDHAYIDATLGYNSVDIETTRNSVFQESNRLITQTDAITSGDTESDEFLVTINAGYLARIGGWNVTPSIGLTYIDTSADDYFEEDVSGSGLALEVNLASQSALIGQVSLAVSRAISLEGWVLVPQLRIDYVTTLDRDRSESGVRFVNDTNATTFSLQGDKIDDDRIDIAVGVFGVFPNGWIPYLEYQITTGVDDYDRYRIAAGLRVEL